MKLHYLLFLVPLVFTSCKKEWLEVKPKKSLMVPETVAAYQAILDNSRVHNTDNPGISEIASGDFYVTDETFDRLNAAERIAYLWQNDPSYQANSLADWNSAYSKILRLNIVIEGIEGLKQGSENIKERNNVKGSALFLRAFNHFLLSQIFAPPYSTNTASGDLGIPIRLNADVNDYAERGTLQRTFEQIIEDLVEAKELLPLIAEHKTRPSKLAVFALLSRIYLIQQNYSKALAMADSCLNSYGDLMDYNGSVDIDITKTNPISRFNVETIFLSRATNYSAFSPSRLVVDTTLYKMYQPGDLRKHIFFREDEGMIRYKGSYDGTRLLFTGLATDEIYLTRAECYAREGMPELALADLNTLLRNRTDSEFYTPVKITESNTLLSRILAERRKELCFRTIRWSDLRRLNFDSETETTLSRVVQGQDFELLPGSRRYTFAIPNQEILLNHLEQNQ